ncbi:hypothetical protein MLD38_007850 [Melastoma candidum]|uniref:Uncharacterized protein n=1 Tax=Melastoma candidum TaxID=119954 RepID=A0ACB9RTN7_9MYRT|nr:hypothetical protein MLD38_007850 [Melastoma candidum]
MNSNARVKREVYEPSLSFCYKVRSTCTSKGEDVPALFFFGDSMVDVGTNNYIESIALADFPYNGIDFPHSNPTGRFSNGYNIADEIGTFSFVMIGSPPPYYYFVEDQSTSKKNILEGVNFASGGSGILPHTGFQQFIRVIPMVEQVDQFRLVLKNITNILSPKATSDLLSRALFIISVGSNDLDEYYQSNRTTKIPRQDFMKSIKYHFKSQLRNLHEMGARKFGVIGVPPIGCMPLAKARVNLTKPSSGCQKELNGYAREFNAIVRGLLQELRSDLNGMVYSLGDTYNMTIALMKDPPAYGFANVAEACCGLGKLNGEEPCHEILRPNLCKNRDVYLFWDFYHPTERACWLAAKALFEAGQEFVAPISFRQLASANERGL